MLLFAADHLPLPPGHHFPASRYQLLRERVLAADLAALAPALDEALTRVDADLAVFLAGDDPFAEERYGRTALSKGGLARRDRMVLDACRKHTLPVAVTMAGGYARRVEEIVDIHIATTRLAAEVPA